MSVSILQAPNKFDLYANSLTVAKKMTNLTTMNTQNAVVDGEWQPINRASHLKFGFLGFASTETNMGIEFDSHSIYPRYSTFNDAYWIANGVPALSGTDKNLFVVINCDVAKDPATGTILTGAGSLTYGNLYDTAHGTFDSYIDNVFNVINKYSADDAGRIMISFMAEEDGRDTMPWQAYTNFNGDPQSAADYVTAFRYIYTYCRTHYPLLNNMRFVHWMNCTESFDTDYASFYVGDDYCELNAFSMYNRTFHIWNQPCKNFIRPYVETCQFSIHPIMFGECNCMPTDDSVSTPDPTGLYNKGEWLRRMIEVVDMYFTRVEWIHLFNENTTHLWEWTAREQIVVRDGICAARARSRAKKCTEIVAPNLFPFPMPTDKTTFTYVLSTGSIVTDLPDDLMCYGTSALHVINTNDDAVEASSKFFLVDDGTYMPVVYQANQPFVLSFWARVEQASAKFSFGFENYNGGTLTVSMYSHATITKDWKRYFYICTLPWDITAGTNRICWYIGENAHGVEFDFCGIQICKTTFITPFVISATQHLYGLTNSTSATTGTLICDGGVGFAKDLYVGGTIYGSINGTITTIGLSLSSTVNATSTSTGALIVAGGVGIGEDVYIGSNVYCSGSIGSVYGVIAGTSDTTSTSTGALIVAGGVGIGKDVKIGGTLGSTSSSTGALTVAGGCGITEKLYVGNNLTSGGNISGSNLIATSTTAATNTATGALRVAGGVGIAGACYIGGALTKGSGSFLIPHVDPSKAGWQLRHCFVESDTRGDNIYRRKVVTEDKKAVIELPDYFKFLNENPMIFISPVNTLGIGRGDVNDALTTVDIRVSEDGEYNVLIIGTRKDKIARDFFDEFGCEIPPTK